MGSQDIGIENLAEQVEQRKNLKFRMVTYLILHGRKKEGIIKAVEYTQKRLDVIFSEDTVFNLAEHIQHYHRYCVKRTRHDEVRVFCRQKIKCELERAVNRKFEPNYKTKQESLNLFY